MVLLQKILYRKKDNRLGADGVSTNKRIEIQLVLYLWRKIQDSFVTILLSSVKICIGHCFLQRAL